MPLVTTLNFSGRTEEALNHYGSVLRVETLFLMHCRDCPIEEYRVGRMADLVFHATFRIEDTILMASDVGFSQGEKVIPFSGFCLAIDVGDSARGLRVFDYCQRSVKTGQ